MNTYEFIASILKTLVWPAFILIIFFTLKNQLKGLISRLRNIDSPWFKADLEIMERAAEDLGNSLHDKVPTNSENSGPITENDDLSLSEKEESEPLERSIGYLTDRKKVRFGQLVRQSEETLEDLANDPAKAVINSWKILSNNITNTASHYNSKQLNLNESALTLLEQGVITSKEYDYIKELQFIRYKATMSSSNIPVNVAVHFVDVARKLNKFILKSHNLNKKKEKALSK